MTYLLSNWNAVYCREDFANRICKNTLLRSSDVIHFAPLKPCRISCIGGVFVLAGIIILFILCPSKQIRTGFPSLYTAVNGFTCAQNDSSKISRSIISCIWSLTSLLSTNGIGDCHSLQVILPPCENSTQSFYFLHFPGFFVKWLLYVPVDFS